MELLGVVLDGHDLTATVLVRARGAGGIACEVHAARQGDEMVARPPPG